MLTYEASLDYINSFVNYERTGLLPLKGGFDLSRLERVLEAMASPHLDYRAVHIAGTKGKGSTAVFTASILREAGFRTGLYTSPHLVTPRERISVDGSIITEEALSRTTEKLKAYLEKDGSRSEFSFFEVYTLLAMLYFSMEKVDIAVFECGLGGRLDATNVIRPEVCAITPVSYDHMDILGTSLEYIAREKSGIIKKGTVCVSAPQKEEAMEVIRAACSERGASLVEVAKDVRVDIKLSNEEGSRFDISGPRGDHADLSISMPGLFQVENAATAVTICHLLGDVPPQAVAKGLFNAFIPGRLEVLAREPRLVIDGAQNAESAAKLKYSVEKIFRYDRLILLLGLSSGKDIKGVCGELAGLADEIILTRAAVKRAEDPEVIRGYIRIQA